jgi:hypothetical protein
MLLTNGGDAGGEYQRESASKPPAIARSLGDGAQRQCIWASGRPRARTTRDRDRRHHCLAPIRDCDDAARRWPRSTHLRGTL